MFLHRHHRRRIAGGQGVEVGEDQVAGAVAAESRFVFAADDGKRIEHIAGVVAAEAVEVEVERVEPGAQVAALLFVPDERRAVVADARGERLGLSEDELAFYDALETNDSAVKVLGDETLRDIARELVDTVRTNVSIDWTLRENVRAQLRVLVRRISRKHGYPPDKQAKATLTVLEQAEVLSEGWAAA